MKPPCTPAYTPDGSLILSLRFINALIELLATLPEHFDEHLSEISYHHLEARRLDHGMSATPEIVIIDDVFFEDLQNALNELEKDEKEKYLGLVRRFPEAEEVRCLPGHESEG